MTKQRKPTIKGRERLERDLALIRLVEQGLTKAEIARELGVSQAHVHSKVKYFGLQCAKDGRSGNGRIRTFDYDAAVERYRAGETMAEIAATVGVTRTAVLAAFKKRGITKFDGGYAKKAADIYAAKQAAQ